ncbi:hypothetical protein BVX98_00725, partial [bacterium F11]
ASLALSGNAFPVLPELHPNYIKLNMMTYKDMSKDREKLEEFIKAVLMIKHVGSEVICSRLESRADSYLALRYGITLGQGFLFARPAETIPFAHIKSTS